MILSEEETQRLLDGAAPIACPMCGGKRPSTCASACGESTPPGTWPGRGTRSLHEAAKRLAESVLALYAALRRERETAALDAKVCVDEILSLKAERDAACEEAADLRDAIARSLR